MKRITSASMWLLAAAVLAITQTGTTYAANVVLVTPDNMNGWVIAVQKGTSGTTPVVEMFSGPGAVPYGSGSVHLRTWYSDADPLSKAYIGTNNHTGVSLRDITAFKYCTFVASREYSRGSPPMVEIRTDSGDSTQQRTFVFFPWGPWGNENVQFGVWQEWDLMTSARKAWHLLHTGSDNYEGDWNWLITRKGTPESPMKLVAPPVGDYNDLPPDGAVLTGASINIRVGAGKAIDSRYEAWWQESCGIDAYADKLVIGINGVNYVYDFELVPRTVTTTYGICSRAVKDPVMMQVYDKHEFTLFGRPRADDMTPDEFTLLDSWGQPVRVYAPGHWADANTFVSATGMLDPRGDPPTLTSSAEKVKLLGSL